MRPLLKRFERVFIAYNHVSWDGIDNYRYLSTIFAELNATHSVCAWGKLVVAVRRGAGEAQCTAELGCAKSSNSNKGIRGSTCVRA